ncbi:MAG: hypothetical protein ACLFUL_05955 [Desulfobacteraceae bacterium]
MKKAIASPLCSAFVIPGLGQIINADLKKGIILLCGVFLLFVLGIIKLVRLIHAVFPPAEISSAPPEILNRLRAEDLSVLWYILAAFAILWLYSVIDAFWKGRKMDHIEAGGGDT